MAFGRADARDPRECGRSDVGRPSRASRLARSRGPSRVRRATGIV